MRPRSLVLSLLSVLPLGGVVACSSEPAPAVRASDATSGSRTATSGTRLRARHVVAGDVRQLIAFHDTLRDEDCSFQRLGDGSLRCVPLTAHRLGLARTATDETCTVFEDAASAPPCEARSYALVDTRPGCDASGEREAIRPFEAPRPLYLGQAGRCQPVAPTPGAVLRSLGAPLAWDDFVGATPVDEQDGSLIRTVAVATDGARQVIGQRLASDPRAECVFRPDAEGGAICVPTAQVGPVLYTDDRCTTPSFVEDLSRYEGSCQAPYPYWVEPVTERSSCAGVKAVYSLREGVAATGYRKNEANERDAGRCSAISYFYAPAARPIDADITRNLPRADRQGPAPAGAQLVAARLVPALVLQKSAANPIPSLVPGFYDRLLGTECLFGAASDGSLRCLPVGAGATIFHEGAGCTSPELIAALGDEGCSVGDEPLARATSATCPETTTVYRLKKPSAGDPRLLSTETAPGRCVSVGSVTNAFDAVALAPADLAAGSYVTE